MGWTTGVREIRDAPAARITAAAAFRLRAETGLRTRTEAASLRVGNTELAAYLARQQIRQFGVARHRTAAAGSARLT